MTGLTPDLRIVDFLLGLVVLMMAGILTHMWSEIKSLRDKNHAQQNEVHKLNLLVAGNYVSRPELDNHMTRLQDMVTKGFDKMERQMADIYDELKHKVDKP
jgi:hypothetical protein